MSPTALGLLVSLPILVLAVVSTLVHGLGRRLGVERAVLLVLLVGTVVRSVPGVSALWFGGPVIWSGIAIVNVLLPVVVRQDFPDRVPAVTGFYNASQSGVAGLASGLAVPLAYAAGSWEFAIGVWALLIVFALGIWLPGWGSAPLLPSRPGHSWSRRRAPYLLSGGQCWPGRSRPPSGSSRPPSTSW